MMSLGPYASFIVTSYAAAALVVAILIGWIALDYRSQIQRLRDFQSRHQAQSGPMLERLQQTAIANGNLFEVLVDAVQVCSLGQITTAIYDVGGQYRRNM